MKQRAPQPSNAPVTASTLCQRCLQSGHWTADCKNQYAYRKRPSRTALLNNPKLVLPEKRAGDGGGARTCAQIEAEQKRVLEEVLGGGEDEHGVSSALSESDFSE